MPELVKQADDLSVQLEKMESILDNMDVAIYVSDLVTNKILFANMALQLILEDHSLTGRICWEALRNESKRCAFCRIPDLLKTPGRGCRGEMLMRGRLYQMNDSIIPWADGRLVHMRCMVEMLEGDTH